MRVVVDTETMPKEIGEVIEQLRKENTQLKRKNTSLEERVSKLGQERVKYEDAIRRPNELGTFLHDNDIGDHWGGYDYDD